MEHEEKNEILAAIRQLDVKFEKRFDEVDKRFDEVDKRFDEADQRFKKLAGEVDSLHQSQIKLEGMRGDMQFIGENVASLVKRFNAWEHGDDDEPSIPARVSALEIRVTRLEKKKSRN